MNKKIKIGLIGCGAFGEGAHLSYLTKADNAEVVAICDINEKALMEASEKYGVKDGYTDYTQLLDRNDIEAVAIASPDQLHCEIACAAMKKGKHVMCEKPMALTVEDCTEMIEVQKETGKKLMIGQISRLTPGFAEAKRLVDEGVIGELFFVESEYAHDYSHVSGMDSWRADPLRHVVLGGACHAVDLLRWIAGNPYEVTAYSNKKMIKALPTDDCTIAIMRFPNNVIGKLFASSGCKGPYSMATRLMGTKGTIIINNTDPYITVYRGQVNTDSKLLDGAYTGEYNNEVQIRYPVELSNHNISKEYQMFLDSLLFDKPLLADGNEGLATVRACRAIIQSADENRTISINY